jgi:hypothetical protein
MLYAQVASDSAAKFRFVCFHAFDFISALFSPAHKSFGHLGQAWSYYHTITHQRDFVLCFFFYPGSYTPVLL